MSDNPTLPAAPTPAAGEAAPAAPAPIAAPVAQPPTSVVGAEPAPAAPEPVAASPEPAPVAEPTTETPTAPEAAAPEAPTPEPEPAVAPTYADLKLPEGITAPPAALAEATKLFAELGIPEANAQKLVDLHGSFLAKTIEGYQTTATDFWNKKSQEWVAEARADPHTGGNRFDTSINLARGVWNEVLPDKIDRDRLFGDLTDTKMGDHPLLVRGMAEVGRRMQQVLDLTGTTKWSDAVKKLREPAAPPPGTPARAPGSSGRSPADRRYSRSS